MPDVLERSFATLAINSLVNHPEIRPYVGDCGKLPLDLAPLIDNDRNVFLIGEHGGYFFIWTSPGCYEIHAMVTPDGRGKWAADAVRECLFMMQAHGAQRVWARIIPENLGLRNFAIVAGFKPVGQEVFDIGAGPMIYNLYQWEAN